MGENKNATRGCIMKEKEEIKKLIDEIENVKFIIIGSQILTFSNWLKSVSIIISVLKLPQI